VSRLSPITENQLREPESVKQARSILLHELVEKQEKEKDPIARSLVDEYGQLFAMRKGPAKDALEEQLMHPDGKTHGPERNRCRF
jgi:hypothetical protein